ncbi:hypothetical protein MSAN_01105200 [Mycena sanguinolenta]|uniref:Uncharacterized protein n=1 Tax=Mycena sanguinolenta TaxID=230812 RepID=A0A8H6YTC1_9AGAR|nr:hypothetical protein MSAN_01105200 [Mycena sanguinolenta]
MPSTRLSAESTPVEKPLPQPPVSAHYNAHARREPDLGAKRGGNGWQTLVNYISGGQGGMGGHGLQGRGGAGGNGEGPTLNYEIKAERIVMKNFNGPEATPPDFLRIPLGNIDLRSEIQVHAATGTISRHGKGRSVRRMYSARVVSHSEPMTVALYEGHNAEETGPTSFRWPDRPAYWSLNPSGSNPLSHEEASSLGFPTITRKTWVRTTFWDETVYTGLRKFDECKGFDPESQDLAKELGFPLFEVSDGDVLAMEWDLVDRDYASDYSISYSEEEYATIDGMESGLDLAGSSIEELAMEDEDYIQEFSSGGDDTDF